MKTARPQPEAGLQGSEMMRPELQDLHPVGSCQGTRDGDSQQRAAAPQKICACGFWGRPRHGKMPAARSENVPARMGCLMLRAAFIAVCGRNPLQQAAFLQLPPAAQPRCLQMSPALPRDGGSPRGSSVTPHQLQRPQCSKQTSCRPLGVGFLPRVPTDPSGCAGLNPPAHCCLLSRNFQEPSARFCRILLIFPYFM